MNVRLLHVFVLLLFASAFAARMGSAAVIITPGPSSNGTTETVLFNLPGTESGPFTTVTGRTETSGVLVPFFGTGENLVTPSTGEARIQAETGTFPILGIGLTPGLTFVRMSFNVNAVGTGTVDFLFTGSGLTFPGDTTGFPVQPGSNLFDISASGGQAFEGVDIESNGAEIQDVRQIRVDTGAVSAAVPEPSNWIFVLSGTLLLAVTSRRWKKSNST